jgi:hypothetical protein
MNAIVREESEYKAKIIYAKPYDDLYELYEFDKLRVEYDENIEEWCIIKRTLFENFIFTAEELRLIADILDKYNKEEKDNGNVRINKTSTTTKTTKRR